MGFQWTKDGPNEGWFTLRQIFVSFFLLLFLDRFDFAALIHAYHCLQILINDMHPRGELLPPSPQRCLTSQKPWLLCSISAIHIHGFALHLPPWNCPTLLHVGCCHRIDSRIKMLPATGHGERTWVFKTGISINTWDVSLLSENF